MFRKVASKSEPKLEDKSWRQWLNGNELLLTGVVAEATLKHVDDMGAITGYKDVARGAAHLTLQVKLLGIVDLTKLRGWHTY